MSGQWIEDPTTPSGWRYDDTPSDPSVTSMLPVYAGRAVDTVITAGSPADDNATAPIQVVEPKTPPTGAAPFRRPGP